MQQVQLDRLLSSVPAVAELAPLRDAVVASSIPDPQTLWAHSSEYATYDKRVVGAERIASLVETAAAEARRRVDLLYESVGAVLAAAAADDQPAVVAQLLAMGEAAESVEAWKQAQACYEHAARTAAALPDRRPLAVGLRRLARVHWNLGEVDEALAMYQGALEQADAAGDREGRIVALTGIGNMRSAQGRWSEARLHYQTALEACADQDVRLRGQLFLNLANLSREEGAYDDSRGWLEGALQRWDELGAANQSVWLNNHGLLCMAEHDFVRAELAFRQALEHAPSQLDRAMVLDNLAELAAARGALDEALALARRAEDSALAAGSPWALGIVYSDIGKIFRLRGDANGVTFFEKALEICRERPYPLVEGIAHLEYGIFRREIGDRDEAGSYLERAREIFGSLGAHAYEQQAARELSALAPGPLPAS